MEKINKLLIISSDAKLKEILSFCFEGWGYEVVLLENTQDDINLIKKILPDVIIIDVCSVKPADLKICSILRNDIFTTSIPIITLINKKHLRSHLLNLKYGVDDYLIKPPDPLDLRIRIEMALKRIQLSFYSNPLTGLPGANILEEKIKEYLKQKREFSIGYVDIDNFKYFNDVYGYLKGDLIILQTAYILYNTIKRFGNPDDFVFHIGGDDFAFITTPDNYSIICQNFIFIFDKVMPFHYLEEDRKKGFIIAKDRTNKERKIPLASVSVAIVNIKANSKINIFQINEKIAEIKKYIKNIEGSKYMADRREYNSKETGPYLCNVKKDLYKPIGQILLEKNLINQEQLQEALKIHFKKGIILGEVLKEMNLIKEDDLVWALDMQKRFSN